VRATGETRLFPALLRHWRWRGGLSQLDLALAAGVSSRHVSFLETGRAQPSREMVLRLGGTLGVPLRDQNTMLQAAGFAPEFPEPGLDELPASVALAVERMLAQHEPYPLTVLSRSYDVLRANGGASRIFSRFVSDPSALAAPLNVFALVFDPRLARSYIQGWERLARAMAARLHREALARPGDPELAALLASLFRYEGVPEDWRPPDFSVPSEATLEVRLRDGDLDLGFLTALTQFNAPQNVTLDEIRIESYFPVDDATARACERLARDGC
jgi:transcriptional regulator with XRE-family HTH domain